MAHLSENATPLTIKYVKVERQKDLLRETANYLGVVLLHLPFAPDEEHGQHLVGLENLVAELAEQLDPGSTLITLGDTADLARVHAAITQFMRYQLWIAIKKQKPHSFDGGNKLPAYHFGALVHTKYQDSLKHTKTRVAYSYCPACDKTTKDYGGKKHTYHHFGTLMSDVWRDISCDPSDDISVVVERFADLFGLSPYNELKVLDLRQLDLQRDPPHTVDTSVEENTNEVPANIVDTLLEGDCLAELKRIPDNSVDFVFVDPPYNLGKKYIGYSDDLNISQYFSWCDNWLDQLARVLKPGRTLAILNIPLWSIRHFLHLETVLNYQSWIAWDALAYPVRKIMPAHYAILCFSKGTPRELPGLDVSNNVSNSLIPLAEFEALYPLGELYCLRSSCVRKRRNDRGPLTDLWWDIHRLKHNTRRVDHPTQLPPNLLYRLIAIYSRPKEIVLDCFNGSGTTTLAAHQLNRHYIGIEKSHKYHELALSRHNEIDRGLDPFRKRKLGRKLAKNSPVPRIKKQTYEVPKKTLQLEVKRIAQELEHLPSREELIEHSNYPIEYYDDYFVSWGEIYAAARTTGMTEERPNGKDNQLTLL